MGYSGMLVNNSIDKAKSVPREKALRKQTNIRTNKRPVFAVKFDPRLSVIQVAQAKYLRAMVGQDQYLAQYFLSLL